MGAGIEFVSPAAIWDGHEPCGSKGQYTNSFKAIFSFKNPVDGGSFHPNVHGQEALARLVACYLNVYRSHRPSSSAGGPAPTPAAAVPGSIEHPLLCPPASCAVPLLSALQSEAPARRRWRRRQEARASARA